MTPLKANTFISFILLFVLLLLSGGAASQHRRGKVVPPDTQRTDSLQRGDTLQVGDTVVPFEDLVEVRGEGIMDIDVYLGIREE